MSNAFDERRRGLLHTYPVKSLWLIALCFILSGATGLIYEVLWARMLGLVFGATTFAISTVLAAFMGGLALGSAWAGRLAARIRRPLRAYGLIEIAIALYALAVPYLFALVNYLYALVWAELHPGFYSFSLWRFVLSSAVLLVPTGLMGATLPVLSAALVRSPEATSSSVARLYTYNLVGAIFGTIIAGFFLLPSLGVSLTIYTAAAINIVVGICAFLIDLKYGKAQTAEDAETTEPLMAKEELSDLESGEASPESQPASEKGSDRKFWLMCAAVSGFVTISAQVAWTRVLTMVIGSSTYAFSIVVALFLLGLSGGAYMVGHAKIKETLRRKILKVEVTTAVSLLLSLLIVNQTPNILINMGLKLNLGSWAGLLALQIFVAGLLILLPALLMGMVMPLVLVWAGEAGGDASVRLVGRSYALNTLGAIAGAFSTGFILIPKASTRFTILFAATLCVIVAGFAYEPPASVVDKDLRRGFAAGATMLLIILLFVAAPKLDHFDLSLGAYDSLVRVLARTRSTGGNDTRFENRPEEIHQLLMYEEGPTATVSVRNDWDIISLAINGRTNASDKEDMPTQVMLGQMPLLLAPRIDNGLIVGFGSGVTVGSMLQSPIKQLECVELEPAVIRAGDYFNHVNNRPRNDPRLRLIVDDARAYLRVNPTAYNMIVSEPSHPWVPGVANLFTREFFELGRSRLTDDGVFVQWLQIYQLSNDGLRSVLATYKSVFPHVLVFRVGGATKGKDLLLVGSRTPLSLERITERFNDPQIRAELARIKIAGRSDVESWYVCDETQLAPAVEGAIINTDDNMSIENRTPREAFLPLMEVNAKWIEQLAAEGRATLPLARSEQK